MNERWIRSFDSDSFKRINNDVKCQKIKLDMIAAHFIISFSSIILANYVVQTIDWQEGYWPQTKQCTVLP